MKIEPSDLDELRPIIEFIVEKTVERIDRERDRIALTEPEAAASLGVPQHVLGDARRRGQIKARKIGKRYFYTRGMLRRWIENK